MEKITRMCPVCGITTYFESDPGQCEIICVSCGTVVKELKCYECPVCDSWDVVKRYDKCDCICASCGAIWDFDGQITRWAIKLR